MSKSFASDETKLILHKRIVGNCCVCDSIPVKIILIDLSETEDDSKTWRWEEYCQRCFDRLGDKARHCSVDARPHFFSIMIIILIN